MKRILMFGVISAVAIVLGCSSTFRISKEGKGYFWGTDSKAIHAMLCESGDLKKILTDAETISQGMKDDLYRYNCTAERSGVKVKEIYAAMSPAERKGLRQAFKKNGYEINAMTC
jgi:hypothetical protein